MIKQEAFIEQLILCQMILYNKLKIRFDLPSLKRVPQNNQDDLRFVNLNPGFKGELHSNL